jgi:hypothetical protein
MNGATLVKWRGMLSGYNDSLWAGRSGDRIPIGTRFSAHVPTGPEAHPASNTMGTGSFPGVKRPGRDAEHPPHLALGPTQPPVQWVPGISRG